MLIAQVLCIYLTSCTGNEGGLVFVVMSLHSEAELAFEVIGFEILVLLNYWVLNYEFVHIQLISKVTRFNRTRNMYVVSAPESSLVLNEGVICDKSHYFAQLLHCNLCINDDVNNSNANKLNVCLAKYSFDKLSFEKTL